MTAVTEVSAAAATPASFAVPDHLAAQVPPEARGLARDGVRLLVARPSGVTHARFRDIGSFLRPGDLLVVNTSRTRAAAVDGSLFPANARSAVRGRPVVVHLALVLDDGELVVELRRPDAGGPVLDAAPGQLVGLAGGSRLRLTEPFRAPEPGAAADADPPAGTPGVRLWRASAVTAGSGWSMARAGTRPRPATGDRATDPLSAWDRYGRPITYRYLRGRWPLSAYQTVFARSDGSAEMPSAGRPFSLELVTELVSAGIGVAPVLLHCGVSSADAWEGPLPERFAVPAATARMVEQTRRAGGRVVAVGTTVTRALESAAAPDGRVRPRAGWTDLVLSSQRPSRVVDGLVTGWHEATSSHLRLLVAVAGPSLVGQAYDAALDAGYLWHEFGDSCLLLP